MKRKLYILDKMNVFLGKTEPWTLFYFVGGYYTLATDGVWVAEQQDTHDNGAPMALFIDNPKRAKRIQGAVTTAFDNKKPGDGLIEQNPATIRSKIRALKGEIVWLDGALDESSQAHPFYRQQVRKILKAGDFTHTGINLWGNSGTAVLLFSNPELGRRAILAGMADGLFLQA